MTLSQITLWQTPQWLDEVRQWAETQLAAQNRTITGPLEQVRVRAWSTVVRVPTDLGVVYFKATAPAFIHETAVTLALVRWQPLNPCLPVILASDLGRGWLILGDGGERLRDFLQTPADVHHWQTILPLYAQLQIELTGHVAQLHSLGTLDRRLEQLPRLYEQLLNDTDTLYMDQPEGLTSEQHRRLWELQPRYAALCQELAAFDIPHTSLDHSDFHDGNIFVRQEGGGYQYTFADWGDCGLTHPFFTLIVTLRNIANAFKWELNGPEIAQLRDLYLAPWQTYAPMEQLQAACDLANKVGTLTRALTWHRVLTSTPVEERAEFANGVAGWLQEFLELETGSL